MNAFIFMRYKPKGPSEGEGEREREQDFNMVTVTKGVYSRNGTGPIGGMAAVYFMFQDDVIY